MLIDEEYPSKTIKLFGVYRVYTFMGSPARMIEVALPTRNKAEEWISTQQTNTTDTFMVEEIEATMKPWKP